MHKHCQLSFWKCSPWKQFYNKLVFSDLKCSLHVDEMTNLIKKNKLQKYPCPCGLGLSHYCHWQIFFDKLITHFEHLRVRNLPPHHTLCSTYEGVCLYFNESRGNGLFNLASELGWILWLRIWQRHFHTLRKWWFYTCWLSPCVKRLFHHCQRQMRRCPSCHTELLERSLITTD